MSAITLRLFALGDLPLITAAAATTGWNHLTAREQQRASPSEVARRSANLVQSGLVAPGSICIVGEQDGRPVAYEVLLLRTDELTGIPTALKVDGWVAPALRGQSINLLLHQAGEEYCRRMGVERMTCVVAAHNLPALRATDRSGFVTERLVRAKWLT